MVIMKPTKKVAIGMKRKPDDGSSNTAPKKHKLPSGGKQKAEEAVDLSEKKGDKVDARNKKLLLKKKHHQNNAVSEAMDVYISPLKKVRKTEKVISKKSFKQDKSGADESMETDSVPPQKKAKFSGKDGKPVKKFRKPQDDSSSPQKKKKTFGKDGKPFNKFKKPYEKDAKKIVTLTKKERRDRKQKQRKHPELAGQLLQNWEELRREETSDQRRQVICDMLLKLVQGKVRELVFAHDTVRVFESLIQHGKEVHRLTIFEELKNDIIPLSFSKYAKFIVLKMLTYGSKEQRIKVFAAMEGKVGKLLKHKHASEVVEMAYNDFANASQRSTIIQELYGPMFAVFKSPQVATLEQAIALDPGKKSLIVEHLKKNLVPMVEKGLGKLSIVQHVLLEYLNQTDSSGESVAELVEALREQLVPMLHTREGVKVAMQVVWQSSTKERKTIVRALKAAISGVCCDEHGYLLILALLDCVDDVVMLNKMLLKELLDSLSELVVNKQGRKVLLYILERRHTTHFPPQLLALITPGDGNTGSKKDPEVRAKEVLIACAPRLLKFAEEHTEEMLADNAQLLLLTEILTRCHETPEARQSALQSVCTLLTRHFVPQGPPIKGGASEDPPHLIESPAGQIILRALCKHDKDSGDAVFSRLVVKSTPGDQLRSWLQCNRGCFFLVHLYETKDSEVVNFLSHELGSTLPKLAKSSLSGAQVLYKHLK